MRYYSYYYGSNSGWQLITGLILGLICTILLYVLVFAKSRDNVLGKFGRFLKNYFLMRYFIVEKIARFLFVLETMACIFVGFFLLFGRTFLIGLLLMVIGPIVLRLVYEMSMMIVYLVKNTMEINGKIKGKGVQTTPFGEPITGQNQSYPPQQAAPWMYNQQPAQTAAWGYAQQPAAPAVVKCPNCGTVSPENTKFCAKCGTKVRP